MRLTSEALAGHLADPHTPLECTLRAKRNLATMRMRRLMGTSGGSKADLCRSQSAIRDPTQAACLSAAEQASLSQCMAELEEVQRGFTLTIGAEHFDTLNVASTLAMCHNLRGGERERRIGLALATRAVEALVRAYGARHEVTVSHNANRVTIFGDLLPAAELLQAHQETYGAVGDPFASRSAQRALLTPQVNPGSLYRCGKSTFKKEQPVCRGGRERGPEPRSPKTVQLSPQLSVDALVFCLGLPA